MSLQIPRIVHESDVNTFKNYLLEFTIFEKPTQRLWCNSISGKYQSLNCRRGFSLVVKANSGNYYPIFYTTTKKIPSLIHYRIALNPGLIFLFVALFPLLKDGF